MLHVDINKLRVNIIKLHADMIILHVGAEICHHTYVLFLVMYTAKDRNIQYICVENFFLHNDLNWYSLVLTTKTGSSFGSNVCDVYVYKGELL